MKKIRFKGSPELGDGNSFIIFADVGQLHEAIDIFAEGFANPESDEGESFTVELVAMTDEEIAALPEC